MKLLSLSALAASILLGVTACSPMSSGGDLFASGRDGRVYNPANGRYEWSGDDEKPRPRRANKAPAVSSTLREKTPPTQPGDGRVYNPATGRYEWSEGGTPKASPFQQ